MESMLRKKLAKYHPDKNGGQILPEYLEAQNQHRLYKESQKASEVPKVAEAHEVPDVPDVPEVHEVHEVHEVPKSPILQHKRLTINIAQLLFGQYIDYNGHKLPMDDIRNGQRRFCISGTIIDINIKSDVNISLLKSTDREVIERLFMV
jgi:hypothetical protein